MAEAVKLSTRGLPFFEIQKNVQALEISLIALGLIALIGATVLLSAYQSHWPLTKVQTLVTATTLIVIGSVLAFAGMNLARTLKLFPDDAAFYKPYPTFGNFYSKFGWKPFIDNKISPNSNLIKDIYCTKLFVAIKVYGDLLGYLSLYSGLTPEEFTKQKNSFKRENFQHSVHYLTKILFKEPQKLQNAVYTYFDKNKDISNAKVLMAMFPQEVIDENQELRFLDSQLNAIKAKEDAQLKWCEFLTLLNKPPSGNIL